MNPSKIISLLTGVSASLYSDRNSDSYNISIACNAKDDRCKELKERWQSYLESQAICRTEKGIIQAFGRFYQEFANTNSR